MTLFWNWLDRVWIKLASFKLAMVLLVVVMLLSIPGTIILQYNISNVDPGIQYDYDFWHFAQKLQLFTSYHSFWYVALIVAISIMIVACSEQRWPQMWKLATAKPVALGKEAIARQPEGLRHHWNTTRTKDEVLGETLAEVRRGWAKPLVLEQGPDSFQVFWQAGRWSRIANYLVHTSLLTIFAGGLVSSLYGFEGAVNIPNGGASDSFLMFKEGKSSGLKIAPGGLKNERLFGFRVQATDFEVQFYKDYPGRPKAFISQVNILEKGRIMKSGTLRVNEPMKYKNFTLYQASYGPMDDFDVQLRLVDKKTPFSNQSFRKVRLGEPIELAKVDPKFGSDLLLVPIRAAANIQSLGPGVQFQEFRGHQPAGRPFWVLQNFPQFDFERREGPYGIVLDGVKELYFTGLQVASDPGAPIYWLGCAGLLIGTFYALFVTHRKYYLRFERGEIDFVGTIHRLPLGFQAYVAKLAERLKASTTTQEQGVKPS